MLFRNFCKPFCKSRYQVNISFLCHHYYTKIESEENSNHQVLLYIFSTWEKKKPKILLIDT